MGETVSEGKGQERRGEEVVGSNERKILYFL